jgi:hypothetical protein
MDIQGDRQDSESFRLDRFERGAQRPVQGSLGTHHMPARAIGGHGILDLTMLGYALRLCWAWVACVDLSQSWSALPAREERLVRAMFDASTTVHLADGRSALFLRD